MTRLPRLLGRLPKRYRYTLHNLVGHPLMEVLWLAGFPDLSDLVHLRTQPAPPPARPVDSARWQRVNNAVTSLGKP